MKRLGRSCVAPRAAATASSTMMMMAPPMMTMMSATRHFNQNPATQAKMQNEFQEGASKVTTYDFDKEKWAKQMKFASMDCILNPDITPIKYLSWTGAKKAWRRYITMKKLVERMPEFDMDLLRELYSKYKQTCNTKNMDDLKLLTRLTTHGETARLTKEVNKEIQSQHKASSWKSIKSQTVKGEYEIEVGDIEVMSTYLVTLADDDWLQITTKIQYKERQKADEEFVSVTEFPVYEVRMGDTQRGKTNGNFIVVAVMKKDGSRYGRDAQDAAQLRKNFEKSQSWF